MKRKVLLSVLAAGTILSAGIGVNSVLADTTNYPPIVTRLANKFNLNETDVEAVFDAVRQERQDEMIKNQEEQLNLAVSDGVITEDQKNAIIEKRKENSDERLQERENMQAWYAEQGIETTKLREYLHMGHTKFGPKSPMN